MKNLLCYLLTKNRDRKVSCWLLVMISLIAASSASAQTPTVADLQAAGTNIQWYTAPTGGILLDPSTPLIHGQHYYGSQTINGVESAQRTEVIANLLHQQAPGTIPSVPGKTMIVWKWDVAENASGYLWGQTNDHMLGGCWIQRDLHGKRP